LVVGLQRGCELEPILWPLRRDRRVRCVELPVSPYVVERPREARIARRRERLAEYLERAQPRLLNLRQIAIYDLERLVAGALLAFQDAEGFVLDLGVVEQVDHTEATAVVHMPLASFAEVASVRLGTTRWDLVHDREI
jgi:hypothetical protein